jgi:hypothetical protein
VLEFARRNKRFAAVDRAISRDGLKFVTLLRLSPLLPLAASNYLYGLTSVDLGSYVLGSWLGEREGLGWGSFGGAVLGLPPNPAFARAWVEPRAHPTPPLAARAPRRPGMLPGTYAYVTTGHVGKAVFLDSNPQPAAADGSALPGDNGGGGALHIAPWQLVLGLVTSVAALAFVGHLARKAVMEADAEARAEEEAAVLKWHEQQQPGTATAAGAPMVVFVIGEEAEEHEQQQEHERQQQQQQQQRQERDAEQGRASPQRPRS